MLLVAVDGFPENRRERVVVGLRDRVILVVVAAHTFHREAEHCVADRRQHVVELVVADALLGFRRELARIRPGHEETRRRRALIRPRRELVARELPAHEIAVGQVVIERADHPVAVVIRAIPVGVELVAVALRVAHQVQPMPAPAFPVARAGQQPV